MEVYINVDQHVGSPLMEPDVSGWTIFLIGSMATWAQVGTGVPTFPLTVTPTREPQNCTQKGIYV